MNDVPHVVVSIDVGVFEDTVQVLVDGFDDDVRVTGKDGDEGPFGEQHPYLQKTHQRSDLDQVYTSTSSHLRTCQGFTVSRSPVWSDRLMVVNKVKLVIIVC